MINNMFMKDYDTFMKELKEGKIEHPEDWTTVDLAKAKRMEETYEKIKENIKMEIFCKDDSK